MGFRVRYEFLHPLQRPVYVTAGYGCLFRKGVGEDSHSPLVKKVQQAIVDTAEPYPQLVDAVTK